MRREVRFSGFGGQGVILAGVMLGTAATLYDGKHAVQTQSYGPAARGGACKSDVIVGEDEIRYPKIKNTECLIALSQLAFDKYKKRIHELGGVIITDSGMVTITEADETYFKHNRIILYPVNAIETAEKLGNKIAANMVMLGALSAINDAVSLDALKNAIRSHVPKPKQELNLKAVSKGFEIGGKLKK